MYPDSGCVLGVKSTARRLVDPSPESAPKPTGFAAYRATVNVEKMKDDPDMAWLLTKPALNIW